MVRQQLQHSNSVGPTKSSLHMGCVSHEWAPPKSFPIQAIARLVFGPKFGVFQILTPNFSWVERENGLKYGIFWIWLHGLERCPKSVEHKYKRVFAKYGDCSAYFGYENHIPKFSTTFLFDLYSNLTPKIWNSKFRLK